MTQKGELTWPRPQSWLGGGPGFGPRGSDCRSYWLECILASRLCVLLLSFSFSKMMSVLFCFLFCEDKHKVFETLNIMDTWRFQFCEKSDIFTPLGVPPPPDPGRCCPTENNSHFCQSQLLRGLVTIWNGMGIHSPSSALPTHRCGPRAPSQVMPLCHSGVNGLWFARENSLEKVCG